MSIRQRNAHFTDWAAVCRALNTATESEARTALESSDNPFYYYVCYIKNTKEIYTHGQFYNCSEHEDLLQLIQALTEEVTENEEVTAKALSELSENKASRGEVEMLDLSKQDKIDDLDSIRTKANNAVQPDQISNFVSVTDLAKVSTTGNYNDLNNKPTIPDAQVNSDWNATSGKAKILNKPSLSKVATTGSYNDLTNRPTIPSAVTETTVSGWGFTKNTGTYSKPSAGIPKSDLASAVQISLGKADTALQSVPTEYITETELAGMGYSTVTYVDEKVAAIVDGAPETLNTLNELAAALKDNAGIVDVLNNSIGTKQNTIEDLETIRSGAAAGATALQNVPEGYATKSWVGGQGFLTEHQDITGKQDNISDLAAIRDGASKGATAVQPSSLAAVATSGNYNDLTNKPTIPAAVTESTVNGWGFTKNTGTYSKPSGGIPKYDLASAVQRSLDKADTALQSYTEQYTGTVNAVKIDNVAKNPSSGLVDLGYINKQLSTSTSETMALSPNIYYRNTNTTLSKLTITLGSVSNSNIINEYFVEFTTSSTGTTVSLPSTVRWANGSAPTFDAGCTYQVSIINNLGTYIKFA